MKQVNVISPVYKNQAVNFNGFIVNFDANGKGVLKFEDNQTEKAEKIFSIHPNIYKGDKLPKNEVKTETTAQAQENNNSAVTAEIEILKESNKKLALENAELKKENEALKKENEVLKKELVDNKEEENSPKEENVQNEETSLKDDLNKKTIKELKELLDTEDFLPFKEEWKSLTKKEDIINFILTKVEEN